MSSETPIRRKRSGRQLDGQTRAAINNSHKRRGTFKKPCLEKVVKDDDLTHLRDVLDEEVRKQPPQLQQHYRQEKQQLSIIDRLRKEVERSTKEQESVARSGGKFEELAVFMAERHITLLARLRREKVKYHDILNNLQNFFATVTEDFIF